MLATTFNSMEDTSTSGLACVGNDDRDFVLEGVFIHPDHLAQGLFADETVDSCPEISSSASYENEAPVAELTGLALNCGMVQDATHDYFAPRSGSCNPSPFYSGSTDSSQASSLFGDGEPDAWSAATTPTGEAPVKPHFSRRSFTFSVASDTTSPAIPATFSFTAFRAPTAASAPMTRVPSRSSSPTRSHPYSRASGGAAMTRSVSSPVETQRQVEDRQRRISIAEIVMDERAIKMARSQSTASTPTLGSFPLRAAGSASMARSSSKPLFSPLSPSTSTGWGNLPAVPSQSVATRPSTSMTRGSRAHSFAGLENYFPPPGALAEPRRSIPVIPYDAGSSSARQSRRVSRIFPLTPILPQSPELVADASCAMQAAVAVSGVACSEPLVRARLHRGMTF